MQVPSNLPAASTQGLLEPIPHPKGRGEQSLSHVVLTLFLQEAVLNSPREGGAGSPGRQKSQNTHKNPGTGFFFGHYVKGCLEERLQDGAGRDTQQQHSGGKGRKHRILI